VRRETGKEYVVKFHDDEGVANHINLEPCAAAREGGREASAEGRIGQPLSRERTNEIYEAEFLGFSYGFRPGRSQHDALDALWFGNRQDGGEVGTRRRHSGLF